MDVASLAWESGEEEQDESEELDEEALDEEALDEEALDEEALDEEELEEEVVVKCGRAPEAEGPALSALCGCRTSEKR
jgi:hypothetical protein